MTNHEPPVYSTVFFRLPTRTIWRQSGHVVNRAEPSGAGVVLNPTQWTFAKAAGQRSAPTTLTSMSHSTKEKPLPRPATPIVPDGS